MEANRTPGEAALQDFNFRVAIVATPGVTAKLFPFHPEVPLMSVCKNVFEAILKYGHDEDFDPELNEFFLPTDAPAGSAEKIEILRRRVELGQPLWHTDDRVDYAGLTGVIRPRE